MAGKKLSAGPTSVAFSSRYGPDIRVTHGRRETPWPGRCQFRSTRRSGERRVDYERFDYRRYTISRTEVKADDENSSDAIQGVYKN